MLDIISIGDATLDTFIKIHDATVTCTLVKKHCQLCLDYANKIPITRLDQKVAGNALNNAVGASRLGMRAGFYSVIGNDHTGDQIMRRLKHEKVSLKYMKIEKGKHTNYSVVLNFQGERTLLTYSYARHYALPKDLEPAFWVYYTAIGKKHARLESQILKYVRDNRVKLAFNPGTVHLKEGVRKIRDVLRECEIVFVNKEEAEELVGDSADIPELLARLHGLGPRIAVITDAKNGAYASDTIHTYHLPIFPMKFVEATGAGDAFATGFVAGLHHGNNLPEALRWGAANAGSVVGKIGPQDGLLKFPDLHKILHRFIKIQPKIMGDGRKTALVSA